MRGAADHLECIARTPHNDETPPTYADGNSCPSPESPEGYTRPPPDEDGATDNTEAEKYDEPGRRGSAAHFLSDVLIEGHLRG